LTLVHQQEALKLAQQIGFQFALVERLLKCQKIKNVGVFEHLTNEVRLRGGQESFKTGDGLAFAAMRVGLAVFLAMCSPIDQ